MAAPKLQLDEEQILAIARALADPKRFDMLLRIGQSKEAPTCTSVRDWTGLAPATVSHHLKELENAGLVEIERCGKFAHITMRRDVWKAYLKRLSAI